MKEELIFYERQRFNKWWVILILAVPTGIFIYGCIIQIGLRKPWGDNQMSDTILIAVTVLLILAKVSLIFFRIDMMINVEGVWIRGFPFRPRLKFTPWDDITEFEVRKKNIRDNRGIGYKMNPKWVKGAGIQMVRRATYNLSGNYVLELTLKNNKGIIIGTQQPEELTEFLEKIDAGRKQK